MFDYIIDKIEKADFVYKPFKMVYLEDFLSEEHFKIITTDAQIKFSPFSTTEDMLKTLLSSGYKPVSFPGCTTDINQYLNWYRNRGPERIWNTYNLTEGFGLSLRLQQYKNQFIKDLVDFLNTERFLRCLKTKFAKNREVSVETAIQKYVTGYEISPHPDIRKKCLTYMVNINTDEQSEIDDIHTSFLSFNPEYEWVRKNWRTKTTDRCWVPWSWCHKHFEQRKNNSISIFAPSDDSLHAVKLDYDHCKYQRTQIYGNLWYKNPRPYSPANWKQLQRSS